MRTLRLALVTTLVAAGLTIIPLPSIAWAEEVDTITRLVDLRRVESVVAKGLVELSPLVDTHDVAGVDITKPLAPIPPQVLGAAETGLAKFTTIGVTLNEATDGVVAFRVREPGGWSPWRELSFSDDHAAEGEEAERSAEGVISEPFFVGAADGYELQVPPDVDAAEVHLVTVTDRKIKVDVSGDEAGGATPQIHRRSAWGARAPKAIPTEAGKLSMAVVHHTAGSASASTPAILRSIQAYHMDVRRWDDIGYNFAVDTSGQIWEARAGGIDRAIIGAHAGGFNTGSTGVVVLGNYDYYSPTNASVSAVENVLAWKLALHHVPTGGSHVYRSGAGTKFGSAGTAVRLPRILGHRDVGTTSCPGGHLHARRSTIQSGATQRSPEHQRTVPAKTLAGDWNGDRRDDLLLYRPGDATDRVFIATPASSSTGLLGNLLGGSPPATVSYKAHSVSVGRLYEPLVGDFNGDGRDDIFWYREGGARDYLWFGLKNGRHSSRSMRVDGWFKPSVGDFDGDGRDDILWLAPWGGADHVWHGNANGTFTRRALKAPGNDPQVLVGDYNGDAKDDILFYGAGSSPDGLWYGHSRKSFRGTPVKVGNYMNPLVGDFTGDGRDDIFWYKAGRGDDWMWMGRAGIGNFKSRQYSVDATFDPIVGDFDGNGRDDIFWNRRGSRQDYQWMFGSGGNAASRKATIESSFKDGSTTLTGTYFTVVDFDRDGRDEILTQEKPTGGRLWTRTGANRFSPTAVG